MKLICELKKLDVRIIYTLFIEIRFEYKCRPPEYVKDQAWAEINVIGADAKVIGVRSARNILIILQTLAAVEDEVRFRFHEKKIICAIISRKNKFIIFVIIFQAGVVAQCEVSLLTVAGPVDIIEILILPHHHLLI